MAVVQPTDKNKNETELNGECRPLPIRTLATPPDGGWGWVVVMSSFTIFLVMDGISYSGGIFFQTFKEYFNASKTQTSWIGSVLTGTYLSVGPVAGALANRFGCRTVATAGSLIAGVSFFVSTFSTSMPILILTYGLFAGFGFGLMYLPAIVMVGYYFEERRALATGIACCGSGIGQFVIAPMCTFLLEEYSWKGATWILSGLLLNGVVFSQFYLPIEPKAFFGKLNTETVYEIGEFGQTANTVEENANVKSSDYSYTLKHHVPTKTLPHFKPRQDLNINYDEANTQQNNTNTNVNAPEVRVTLTDRAVKSFLKINEDDCGDVAIDKLNNSRSEILATGEMEVHRVQSVDSQTFHSEFLIHPIKLVLPRMAVSYEAITKNNEKSQPYSSNARRRLSRHQNLLAINNPLMRKDIFYSGSICHLPEFKQALDISDYRQSVVCDKARVPGDGLDRGEKEGKDVSRRHRFVCSCVCDILQKMFDVTLMRSPTFLLLAVSNLLCMAGFFVPFIYLPTVAQDLGIDAVNASFLISMIGIANTVGRVVVGYVSDQPWADCLWINNIALVVSGVSTGLIPFLETLFLLRIYSFVFGTSVAVIVSLQSIIMVELMGLEKLTNAFGLVIMCQGISSFIGAPIAGFLSDLTGDYNISFYVAGFTLTLSGLICFPLRCIARWELAQYSRKFAPKST